MSSISAGTTTGTALVSTGDTTGQLVLKTNGSTTAVTIGTDQVVTLAQALPAASGGTGLTSPGTSGNVLQSNGTGWVSAAFSAGFSGGTNVTSATDVTLTSSSTQVQRVTMTATSKNVILPDATTCTKGGVVFSIINVGTNPFSIVDASGFSYGVLNPSQGTSLFLGDNSTAAGKWSTTAGENKFLVTPQQTTTNNGALALALTDTSGVYCYQSAGVLYAVGYTISGTTWTFGSSTTVYTNSSGSSLFGLRLIKLTDTTFIFTFDRPYTTARQDAIAVACSLSGTTVTAGSATTVKASSGNNISYSFTMALRASSSVILCVIGYYNSSNGYGGATYIPISISGTTITVGSEGAWLSPGADNGIQIEFATDVKGSSTFLLGYYKPNLAEVGTIVAVMSGSTVSSWTVNTSNGVVGNTYPYSYSPEAGVVFAFATQSSAAYRYTVSGTTATKTNTGSLSNAPFNGYIPVVGYNNQIVQPYSATNSYLYSNTSSYSTVYVVLGSKFISNIANADTAETVRPTCNVVPTSGGYLAVTISSSLIGLIKGFV